MIRTFKFAGSFTALALIMAAMGAQAAGFQLNEQSAVSVGMANAGTGVEKDASVQFMNPAGITALKGLNLLSGANLYVIDANFKNGGSTNALGQPLGSDSDSSTNRLAPYGYASYGVNDQVFVGLGVYSPFGLATNYGDNSSTRYFADASDLRTIEINPNIAVKLMPSLSIGAGPAIRYSTANFSSGIDDGSLGAAAAIRTAAASAIPASISSGPAIAAGGPSVNNGRFRAQGDDWAVGYKIGTLFTPDDKTAIGIAYHSAIQSVLSGNATTDNGGVKTPLAQAAAALTSYNGPVTAKVDYPDSITVSGSYQIASNLKLAGDFEWTDWSQFKNLTISGANGAPVSSTTENWNDGYRVSIGGEYGLTDQWTLRSGLAYEISPVPDATRTARIPDADRVWLSGGVGYAITPQVSFDFGYSHLFVAGASINQANSLAGTLVGNYDSSADILSADVSYHF
jgi:long-chain fatty acid transport protein